MTKDIAIAATFSDFKVVKTRSIAQFIFESPIENADHMLKILGGIPLPGKEKWFGIAPLNEKPVMADVSISNAEEDNKTLEGHNREAEPSSSAAKPKREMTLPEMVGMFCGKEDFQNFLIVNHRKEFLSHSTHGYAAADDIPKIAAAIIREYCGVNSRSEILPGTPAQKRWAELYNSYAGIRG